MPKSPRVAVPTMRSLKAFVKATPMGALLRPRRFHAYCVGAPKSGTVSAWGMLSKRYRADHEAMRSEVVEMMIDRFRGRLATGAAIRRLRTRDRRLRLEMDSFSLLAMFTEELAAAFPRALFVLTVREPRSWLNSIINQHLNVDVSNRPADRLLRQLLYLPAGAGYSREEKELEQLGLFPVEGYLRGWATHYRWVVDVLPSERLLVLQTQALSDSIERLASFLSIPVEDVDPGRTHLHRAPRNHGVVSRLPESLIEEKVALHCGPLWERIKDLEIGPQMSRREGNRA